MAAQMLLWVVGTAVVSVVFARALNRWADRRTGQHSSASQRHRLPMMRNMDLTPSPSRDELTPCP